MDRRIFILATAALAAGCTRKEETASVAMSKTAPLGIQLYTLRELMAEDVAATLTLVADTGFREVEFAGYFDHTPAELKTMMAGLGLQAPSAHMGYENFVTDTNAVIAHAVEMGHKFLVIPYLSDNMRSLDDYRRHAANFNVWGEACKAAGLQLAYHNHDFEFEVTDGVVPYDLLLDESDPDLVQMQLDLAWAHKAKVDAVAYFTAWPGRFPSFHIKDMDADGNESDIGTGGVPFDSIFSHVDHAGTKHGFVERDHPKDVRFSIQHNFDAIAPLWNTYMKAAT